LPLLAVDTHAREPRARVQRDAGLVAGHRSEHHLVKADLARQLDEAAEQQAADACAARGALDVNRKIGDVVVCHAGVEPVEAGPSDRRAAQIRHDDGVSGATLGEPLSRAVRRP